MGKYLSRVAQFHPPGYSHQVASGVRGVMRSLAILLLALVLPVLMVVALAPTTSHAEGACHGERFADVCPDQWFYKDVVDLAALGVISGFSDGTFRPNVEITRGQLMKLIVSTSGLVAPLPTSPTYADVRPDDSAFRWVEIASEKGVVGGYACGGAGEPCDTERRAYFRPTVRTNRGQIAKMVANAFGLTSAPTSGPTFADVPTSSPYFDYVGVMNEFGIVGGYPCGAAGEPCDSRGLPYFRPNMTATRAQSAKMINISLTAKKGRKSPTPAAVPQTKTPTATATITTIASSTSTPPPSTSATSPATSSATSMNTIATTPTSTPTTSATATQVPQQSRYLYGLLGQGGLGESIDVTLLQQQYDAGVRVRLLQLGWNVLQPSGPSTWSVGTAAAFQQRIDAFVSNNPDVQIVLDFGVQYPPSWVAQIDPLVDQYGTVWQASSSSRGGVNVYWSPTVRQHLADYIARVFTSLDFHDRLWAVRVGMYQGELLYPHQSNSGKNLSFWAFDSNAQAQSPVPGWKPGEPSPNGEARAFYYWYVDNLVGTFNFFLSEIRKHYSGYVAPVTPGIGIWDGTANQLISRNLYDTSLGYYDTGNYWQRIFALLPGAGTGVINWCSSVGDLSGNDSSSKWWEWSSGKIMAYLAHQNGRQIFAENPGRNAYDTSGGADPRTTMGAILNTMRNSGYMGLLWVRQADMSNPQYASLEQYKQMISQYP